MTPTPRRHVARSGWGPWPCRTPRRVAITGGTGAFTGTLSTTGNLTAPRVGFGGAAIVGNQRLTLDYPKNSDFA